MLAKKYRLPIDQVKNKRARTLRGRFVVVKKFEAERPFSRAGVLISKKVSPLASRRNALRRHILEFFRTKGFEKVRLADILCIVQPEAVKNPDAMIKELWDIL